MGFASMTQPAAFPALDDEALVNAGQLRTLFGGVSDMWIARRLNEKPAEGCMPFPRPAQIAGRHYWLLRDLLKWRDEQFKKQFVKRSTRPPPRGKPRDKK
jgi:hypothetical protein